MSEQFSRTELLVGADGLRSLLDAKVCVFGVGGVGGFCVEALARAGVGEITIVDNDDVCPSNINRQIIATWDTVGKPKVEVMAERIHSINPQCTVIARQCFYLPETREDFDFARYDYVVDAIDTVTAKIDLIIAAQEAGTPVISCMGAGNKLDPTRFEVADIYKTSVCKLAKVMRRELRKRGVKKLKCVYSTEEPIKLQQPIAKQDPSAPAGTIDGGIPAANSSHSAEAAELAAANATASAPSHKQAPGSISFVPSVAGLILAGEVIKDLMA